MFSTKDIVYIALFAALTAALALFPPITVPVVPAPITAQTLGVMLAGALAGSRRGGLALALFAVLVAAGLPLLAGGRGGFGIFLGASGGFILSWPVAAFVIGWLFERHKGLPPMGLGFAYVVIGGIGVVYAIGVPWLAVAAELTLTQAITGSLAYIPGDLVKAVVAILIVRGVRKALPGL